MMKKLNVLLFSLLLSFGVARAQDGPYLEALYDVEVTLDQIYAVNATILPIIAQQSTEALPRPLFMDIYEPVGDDNDARPVMLVFHTGNFLPFPANNGTGGTIRDSTVVEVCTRLASMGYVAAAVDYRKGWNPVDPSQDFRKFFLINAAYRGVQDARAATRFMRMLAVDGGNPYGIDPDKIGQWGIGTGGYIVAANNTLEQYQEIVIDKFLIDLGGGPVPMVLEPVNGNLDGTTVGVVPPGYPILPAGDTLNYPNHVNYADGTPIPSGIDFTVNNGGALGDIGWIDENTGPWVSFHVPTDPFAPYTTGVLTVPGTGDPMDPSDDFAVVEVSGSYDIQARLATEGDANSIFDCIPDDFPDFSEVANERNDGIEGLFPFPNDLEFNSSAPWDFYAEDNPGAAINGPPNPELARTYWDTIFAYTAPRACKALDLPCQGLVNTTEVDKAQIGFQAVPNPASAEMLISVDAGYTIQSAQLYDMAGRIVRNYQEVNSPMLTIRRDAALNGLYFIQIRLEEGFAVQKVMFR